MAQSLAEIYLHVVFSTQERVPFLLEHDLRQRAHAYLAGTCKNLGSPAMIVGGVADHVHILCRFGKTARVSDLVRELKRESSKWVKEQDVALDCFYWQNGYGAFSISPGHVERLTNYIANQDEHHKTESFQDEYRRLLASYGITFNEKDVWE